MFNIFAADNEGWKITWKKPTQSGIDVLTESNLKMPLRIFKTNKSLVKTL